MNKLQEIISAVEENNRINEGKWSDWKDVDHILEVYEISLEDEKYEHIIRDFVDDLIKNDGEHAKVYLDAMSGLEYGTIFNRYDM